MMKSTVIQKIFTLVLAMLCLAGPLSAKPAAVVVSVTECGAKGDGTTIDTDAINEAIRRVAEQGGGTVVVPAGVYPVHSVHLMSGVTLHLEANAVLKAAMPTAEAGYDAPELNDSHYQDFGHSHWQNSLLWGIGLKNVTIEGAGLIDGSGVLSRGEPRRGMPSVANKALALKDCRDVAVRGVRFLSCGHFAILATGVDGLRIENVTADTNRDGFDIDCCSKVLVRGCRVNTVNDDAIVLKCSYALGRLKATEDVLIEDCHVSGYDVGSLFDGTCTTQTLLAPDRDGPTGRIKLGTESNGGFRRITIRRCTFTHCRGLALETVDGAAMRKVRVSDLVMDDICNAPLYLRVGDRMRGPEGLPLSSMRDIVIRRVRVTDADSRYGCLLVGTEQSPVRGVKIRDLTVDYRGGITLEDVREQRGSNDFFQRGNGYPEPSAHGIQPAWGINMEHCEDISLRRITMTHRLPDEREERSIR